MDGQIIKTILTDTEVYEDCLTDSVKPILFKVFSTKSEKTLFKHLDALATLNKALYPAMRGTTSAVTLRRLEDNVENPVLRWKLVKGKTLDWSEAIAELVAFYRSIFDKRQPFYKMFPELLEDAVEVEPIEEPVVEDQPHDRNEWVWSTPMEKLLGIETCIYTLDYKEYWAALEDRRLGPFRNTIEANRERRLHIEKPVILPAPAPVEEPATVIPITKRRGRPPKQSYTFDAKEDAELIPVIPSGEDW